MSDNPLAYLTQIYKATQHLLVCPNAVVSICVDRRRLGSKTIHRIYDFLLDMDDIHYDIIQKNNESIVIRVDDTERRAQIEVENTNCKVSKKNKKKVIIIIIIISNPN